MNDRQHVTAMHGVGMRHTQQYFNKTHGNWQQHGNENFTTAICESLINIQRDKVDR
jgi:hypothetical protein